MDTATWHALVLTAAAVLLWRAATTLLRRAGSRGAERPCPENASSLSADALEAELRKAYARRARFRLGVAAGCLLALAGYFSGVNRLLLLVPLLGACWCQYGVYRHRTTDRLAELVRRRTGGGFKHTIL